MHNLLSSSAKKAVAREYLYRVAAVGMLLGAAVLLLGAVSLVPTFVTTSVGLRSAQAEKLRLETQLTSDEAGEKPTVVLARARNLLAFLGAHAREETYTTLLREALNTRPSGIAVSALTFTRADRTFLIGGVAENRDTLVAFSRRLEANPRFERTTLPISDLARSTDLTFRMALVVALPTTTE